MPDIGRFTSGDKIDFAWKKNKAEDEKNCWVYKALWKSKHL